MKKETIARIISGAPVGLMISYLIMEFSGQKKAGEILLNSELSTEIDRLKSEFSAADENKIHALDALIEQAAYERIYLRRLNEQAMEAGLVKTHPDNPAIQQSLPVSGEIAKHAACLTNIMDKLMKHLAVETDEEDDGLADYE